MSEFKFLVMPGDGIGPEITDATLEVLRHADRQFGLQLELDVQDVGYASLRKIGNTVPEALIEKGRNAHGIVLGPCDTFGYPALEDGGVNPSSTFRKTFDLYANIRPSRAVKGVDALAPRTDLIIVRENTEGFYADRNMFAGSGEFMPTADVALAMRKITAQSSRRIARAACELAMQRSKRLTIVTKANVLKLTDGLFLREAQAVAAEFPAITVDHELVDAMASHLVRTPARFDVIVTTNMFGDILSNLASEMAGGLGLAGSLNAGDQFAMAQATHGSANDIAGQGIANPASLMLSVAMLLNWLADRHRRESLLIAAKAIESAVCTTIGSPATQTKDLGGKLSTREFAARVCERIRAS